MSFETEYLLIEQGIKDISPDATWDPILLEDWILHVYHCPGEIITRGKLAPGSPFRKQLDTLLLDKDWEYVRRLFVYIQSLKPDQVRYGQWESWQYTFKPILLKAVKGGGSVYCPYRCILFDGTVPPQDIHFSLPHTREDISASTLVILERPVIDPQTLDGLFWNGTTRAVFSIGNIVLAEQYRHAINSVLLHYDIIIYQGNCWLMIDYRLRPHGAGPSVRMVDLDNRRTWTTPRYALSSVRPSSYIPFDSKPFFDDVDRSTAEEFNRVLTSESISSCNKKVNTLKDFPVERCGKHRLAGYRKVSGPAIIIENNTAVILGHDDRNIAIPKTALSIIPHYLNESKYRDCIKQLRQHAQNLLRAWDPVFDSLAVKMDSDQKRYWCHFIKQEKIITGTPEQQGRDVMKLVTCLQNEYGDAAQTKSRADAILCVCALATEIEDKAAAAIAFCDYFGWHKKGRYPTRQWAEFFNVNLGSFRNAWTKARRAPSAYGPIIKQVLQRSDSDNSSGDAGK